VGGRVFQWKPRAAPVPADTWRLRTSPRQDAGFLRTGGFGWYARVRDTVGVPRPPTVHVERSLLDTWHHRTVPRAGNGSGAVGQVRWALDRGGPAVQPVSAQLRITMRVLPRHSKRGYPVPGYRHACSRRFLLVVMRLLCFLEDGSSCASDLHVLVSRSLMLCAPISMDLSISQVYLKNFNKESVGRKIIALTHT